MNELNDFREWLNRHPNQGLAPRTTRTMNLLIPSLLASALVATPILTNSSSDECAASKAAQVALAGTSDIVDTAIAAGNFNTLAAALGAVDLVATLKGKGPFTVFAPTDAAFAALPKGTVEALLKPENKQTLAGILTYHVVPGTLLAGSVVKADGAVTVNGQKAQFEVRKEGKQTIVMIDGARIVATDIKCSNGVIHVLDAVILPADKNIVETASGAGTFATLLAAAKAAGLAEVLAGEGPFTVFAPTDAAFAALPEGTVANLLKPESKEALVNILLHHVVAGRVYSEQVISAGEAKTLAGTTLKLTIDDGGASIGGGKLQTLDLDASNGVIHVVGSVLLP
ncbi:MAG: transforming growth factor-beta-induced protein [Planctomycetota bacterium]